MAELINKTTLEVKKGDKKFSFECAPDASLGELFDAMCEMRHYILSRMNKAVEEETPKKEEEVV